MICAGKFYLPIRLITETWRIYSLGDTHLGNKGCALEKLQEDIEAIRADPNARVLLMGDLADYISQADRRWDATQIPDGARVRDLADWGAFLRQLCEKTFAPIRGKILGALSGNHEATFQARQAQQQHAAFCAALRIPDLGYCCMFDLVFQKQCGKLRGNGRGNRPARAYRIFAHHGAGAAQTAGGKINRLVKFMNMNDADVYFVGHVHEHDVKPLEYLAADTKCERVIDHRKLGVFSGTYLRTYSEGKDAGYGERAGYSPVPLGFSVVEFQPFAHSWVHRHPSVKATVAI